MTTLVHEPTHIENHTLLTQSKTTCCIVGGGPAGAMLALLLARQGIHVTVLESQPDFDRDFRADTFHPVILEALDDIGLAEGLLELPHSRVDSFRAFIGGQEIAIGKLNRIKTKFPYITILPQPRFLEYMVNAARRYPGYHIEMGARVTELLEEEGRVVGVRYRTKEGFHDLRALLVIGADGRFSMVRKLAGMVAEPLAPNLDLLWVRLPRYASDPINDGLVARVVRGGVVIMFNRFDYWQIGTPIVSGTYGELKKGDMAWLQERLVKAHPFFADRVHLLESWHDATLLSVATSIVKKWYHPGLLLIGDAAHIMSPVGGIGINLAVQDAIESANVLTEPLQRGVVTKKELATVQRKRTLVTTIMQRLQVFAQKSAIGTALSGTEIPTLPPYINKILQLPVIREIPSRAVGWSFFPARIKPDYHRARVELQPK
jgi:2-polyprenyl-6-methoxyphenol hydroxylase-like FAD-dependent oxidoreductase